MAQKRSRTAFEERLTKQESPYAIYGTPLPPLDSETRDDGSYVPVWQQEVRDERGRKRLHGAFTGGFSAGYFNTVGSKEGWTPQTFVSSRTKRAQAQQKAEDFMDDEDMADAEDGKRVQTADGFAGLGSTMEDASNGDTLVGLMRPSGDETMGVKLLQRMGWRQGQGIGPRIRRKAQGDDEEEAGVDGGQTHLFAPSNSKMIGFIKKNDFKGLGYAGEMSLSRAIKEKADHDDDEASNPLSFARPKTLKAKSKQKAKKSSFGVGVLNDTGSDDEDPYEIGPKISYNRVIGGDKKTKKKPAGGANPLLTAKPVFIKKNASKSSSSGFRKCYDGRLPLDGFVLSMQALDISPGNKFAPPKVPDDWKSSLLTTNDDAAAATPTPTSWQSTADAAKSSTLDPRARATMLGEEVLPGKSVFDYISPAARARLAAATGRTDLPTAKGEEAPEGHRQSEEAKQKALWDVVPPLSKVVALEALQRGVNGWMPYAEDLAKRARYTSFLEFRAGVRTDPNALPERAKGATVEEWRNEMWEFAKAAEVFRPMTGVMATRFMSSRSTFEGTKEHSSSGNEKGSLLTTNTKKKEEEEGEDAAPQDPAEAAAKLGMYGSMTRTVVPFHPTRLLCKRFNVPPPKDMALDPGAEGESEGNGSSKVAEVLPRKAIERMMQDAALRRFASAGVQGGSGGAGERGGDGGEGGEKEGAAAENDTATSHTEQTTLGLSKRDVVDVERNAALEAERPGDAVFKAIFGSDDEDE